jgi:hypothetical protein
VLTVAACHCADCGRSFTGVKAFDAHQRWIGGVLQCTDPATATRLDGSAMFELGPRGWLLVQPPGKARPPWLAPGGPRVPRESV